MQRPAHDVNAIQSWLVTRLATLLGYNPHDIDQHETFHSYGLSSREAVELSGDLEDWLERTLPPTLLWDYPTIARLAAHLANLIGSVRREEAGSTPSAPGSLRQEREPIAIIGMGCRFPGAAGLDAFWQLLCDGVDAISEVTAQRWDAAALADLDPEMSGKADIRWGGFLPYEQLEQFDNAFFHIPPREVRAMDPQQRLLLEVAWEALADAGQDMQRLAGSESGVFIGIANSDYSRAYLSDAQRLNEYAGTGNVLSIAANRLSYAFDWHGPSMAIDTACSSSLVALHLACQSLWQGESSLALAGGVNLLLAPTFAISFANAGVMAPDGRCKTFDQRADGYVRGEGVGVVVLKPLAQAQQDHDPIYAVVRGSAVNQDGRTNGLMAPNGLAQQRVVRKACEAASIQPNQLTYIEAHGTGTALGDAIEAQALGEVLAPGRPTEQPCLIGSVKTNIGHLEAAAGIAGLIKMALALKHQWLPPSLHLQTPNPAIPFDQLLLRVQSQGGSWPVAVQDALVGISSFGFGGTNAHVILAPSPVPATIGQYTPAAMVDQSALLLLSAHTPQALFQQAQQYATFLLNQRSDRDVTWSELCTSTALRRTHQEHRIALVADSALQASRSLEEFVSSGYSEEVMIGQQRVQAGSAPKIVFVFSGQGAQWYGMGRQLWRTERIFREALEACELAMRPFVSWSLFTVLEAPEDDALLADIAIVQPVLFALAVGLAAIWRSWGLEPGAVVGHSMGEVAAAYVAGALSLDQACQIICERSKLLQKVQGQGSMLAVEMLPEEAQELIHDLADSVSIAVYNGPGSLVFAGTHAALAQLEKRLEQRRTFVRRVKVAVPAHSPLMDPLQLELQHKLAGLHPAQPAVPFYSTVCGADGPAAGLDAMYWSRNLREPVHFASAIQQLLKDGYRHFIELSPHPLLTAPIEQALQEYGVPGVVIGSLRREFDERTALLQAQGALYVAGYALDWTQAYPPLSSVVSLPAYPWQHEHFPLLSWQHAITPAQATSVTHHTEPLASDVYTLPAVQRSVLLAQEMSYEERQARLIAWFCEQIGEILGHAIDVNEIETPLFALGMDSLTVLDLKRRIHAQFDIIMAPSLFWQYPTLSLLAEYVQQQGVANFEQTYRMLNG